MSAAEQAVIDIYAKAEQQEEGRAQFSHRLFWEACRQQHPGAPSFGDTRRRIDEDITEEKRAARRRQRRGDGRRRPPQHSDRQTKRRQHSTQSTQAAVATGHSHESRQTIGRGGDSMRRTTSTNSSAHRKEGNCTHIHLARCTRCACHSSCRIIANASLCAVSVTSDAESLPSLSQLGLNSV